jgi:hypothetical protein
MASMQEQLTSVGRLCKWCGITKSLEDFPRDSKSREGRRTKCKVCSRAQETAARGRWAAKNPDKVRAGSLRYYYRNREEMKAYAVRYKRQRKYGLTDAEYQALRDAQDGCCAICRRELVPGQTAIDHNHATAAVRGLLCMACNGAIGLLGDSSERLRFAADYLDCNGQYGPKETQ